MYKDTLLANVIEEGYNVAQFFSISPDSDIRYNYVLNHEKEENLLTLIKLFLKQVPSVNVRRFTKEISKGLEFNYGLTDPQTVLELIYKASEEGFFVIVNETIDTHDGGVSGVIIDDLVEFAPNDTPRCVEKPGVCRTSAKFAAYLFKTIYGEDSLIHYSNGMGRVEFSIHPNEVGYYKCKYLIWEYDDTVEDAYSMEGITNWPNKFSQFLGDKAYGLLVANFIFPDIVPTFSILHKKLGTINTYDTYQVYPDYWVRTCPSVQTPGLFASEKNPENLFKFIAEECMDERIPSVVLQTAIESEYSGAAVYISDDDYLVEGVKGIGDEFMLGKAQSKKLPDDLVNLVRKVCKDFSNTLKCPVKIEWGYDGIYLWVFQLHRKEVMELKSEWIVKGEPKKWHLFNVNDGLETLRDLILKVNPETEGIKISGHIGITSHIGDLLRQNKIVSKMV